MTDSRRLRESLMEQAAPASPRPELTARRQRLFVALPLPEFLRQDLAGLAERERHGVHWTPSDQLHLTLKFIGEVDSALGEAIRAFLATIAVEPFVLQLRQTGSFPPRGNAGILWVGAEEVPRLLQLQYRIENGLYSRFGILPEKRVFTPHITLARCRNAPATTVRDFLKKHRDYQSAPWKATHFVLFESLLQPQGSVYQEMARYALQPKP